MIACIRHISGEFLVRTVLHAIFTNSEEHSGRQTNGPRPFAPAVRCCKASFRFLFKITPKTMLVERFFDLFFPLQ